MRPCFLKRIDIVSRECYTLFIKTFVWKINICLSFHDKGRMRMNYQESLMVKAAWYLSLIHI